MKGLQRKQRAATLLEIAIMLPFFLLGIFFILWVGFIVNTKNSLISAVENGVRLASTRGKSGLFQGEVISSFDSSMTSGGIKEFDYYYLSKSADGLGLKKNLLAYNIEGGENFEKVYSDAIDPIFSGIKDKLPGGVSGPIQLNDLPPYYTYAIAYITKAMRMAVGDSIRYPCDPRDENDEKNGENCLFCRPINPLKMNDEAFTPESTYGTKADWTMIFRRVAIRCDYKPGGFITRPLMSMINILGGSEEKGEDKSVMTHFTFFDAFEECFFQPAPQGFDRFCCKDEADRSYCF